MASFYQSKSSLRIFLSSCNLSLETILPSTVLLSHLFCPVLYHSMDMVVSSLISVLSKRIPSMPRQEPLIRLEKFTGLEPLQANTTKSNMINDRLLNTRFFKRLSTVKYLYPFKKSCLKARIALKKRKLTKKWNVINFNLIMINFN